MKITSLLENQKKEKRIAITPETAKKYISLGLEVSLCENYASHLGIKDEEYKEIGVSIVIRSSKKNSLQSCHKHIIKMLKKKKLKIFKGA